jgi:hypothetical protein
LGKRLALIHIPKTGGSYILQNKPIEYSQERDGFIYRAGEPVITRLNSFGHCVIQGDNKNYDCKPMKDIIHKDNLREYLTFSIVRNPFSWLVSYAGHAGCKWGQFSQTKYIANSKCKPHDYDAAQKGFEYLIKTIANRESPWPSRKLLFRQLWDTDGNLAIDFLLKQETLDRDLEWLARYSGNSYTKKSKVRVSKKVPINIWTLELISLIGRVWKRELELFGYNTVDAILDSGTVDKKTVKYSWERDCLEQYIK